MYKYKQIIFFILWAFIAQAQNLHTPTEVQNIIGKSQRVYVFDTLINTPKAEIHPIITKESQFSIKLQENSVDLPTFKLARKERKKLKKANNDFATGKLQKALENYIKIYNSTQAIVLHPRLAYCYEKLGQLEQALLYYNKIVPTAQSDADIHYTIARINYELSNKETALHHIHLAHLFDRNNSAYLDAMIQYYNDKGAQYHKWTFDPIYQLEASTDSSHIHIKSQASPWEAYAACKAIWVFEPGYKKQMKFLSSVDVSIIEEKECLLNALINFENMVDSKDQYPLLTVLKKALSEKRIDDYILYEISARKYPSIIRQLSAKRLEQLVDYIVTYRIMQPVN